ncbi:MAG: hypothetical protein GXO33_04840 [Epsilonproteobacteria bacterium]|nr:hypothetical protein [Campylobacterota bacterium]
MFTAMEHQNRAEKLVQQAVEEVSQSDEAFLKTRERLLEAAERVDRIKKSLAQKSRDLLQRLYETFEGEKHADTPNDLPGSRAEAVALIDRLSCEPVKIENIQKGKGGSFFVALLLTLAALAAAAAGGAAAVGLPLKPETFTNPDNIMKILTFIGGDFYYPSYGNPYVGGVLLAVLALVVWFMAKGFSMGKAARKNLSKAEAVKAAADSYCQNRQEAQARLAELEEALTRYGNLLETCEIYTDEYGATVRRIIHVEGNDYDTLRAPSKIVIERAVTCAKAVTPLIAVSIVEEENVPSPALTQAIEQAQSVVAALVEEREIPVPYIETTVIESEEEQPPIETEAQAQEEASQEHAEISPEEEEETRQEEENTAPQTPEEESEDKEEERTTDQEETRESSEERTEKKEKAEA